MIPRRLPALLVTCVLLGNTASAQTTQTLIINADQGRDTISRHIYGHFAEHLGRGMYDGIFTRRGSGGWTPREDVVQALRAIKIPNLRWPGGCFADYYHWKDGIGPIERRPTVVNNNWGGVTEDNGVGTHEFLELTQKLGAEPFIIPQAQRNDREYNANFPGVRLWRQNNDILSVDRLHSRVARPDQRFGSVTAYASSASDSAQLFDGAGSNTFIAAPTSAYLQGNGFVNVVDGTSGNQISSAPVHGIPAAIALTPHILAVLTQRGPKDRIVWFSATSGTKLGSVLVSHRAAPQLAASDQLIVYQLDRTLYGVSTANGSIRVLAKTAPTALGLSLANGRLVWVDNRTDGGRLRALAVG